MTFNPTIDLGTLLAVITLAGTVFWFVITMRSDVSAVVQRLTQIEAALVKFDTRIETITAAFDARLAKMSEVLIAVARQDERLNAIDVRNNAMRVSLDAMSDRLTTVERHNSRSASVTKIERKK